MNTKINVTIYTYLPGEDLLEHLTSEFTKSYELFLKRRETAISSRSRLPDWAADLLRVLCGCLAARAGG